MTFYNKYQIVFEWQVTVFVAKKVAGVVFGNGLVGVVFKVKSFINQFLFGEGCFFTYQRFFQNPPVFTKRIVNVPHIIIGVGVYFIIERVATHVTTELFIDPPFDKFTAFRASLFFHGYKCKKIFLP